MRLLFLIVQPRNRSEPDMRRRPLNRRDRRQRRRPPRTAPVINLYLQSPPCSDHGDHHCRFTQQHYPLESVEEYSDDEQDEYASNQVRQSQEFERWQQQQSSEWCGLHTRQHVDHCDVRPSGRPPTEGRTQPRFNPASHHQASKSDSNGKGSPPDFELNFSMHFCAGSSISLDSPKFKAHQSGPADTYDDVYISQHMDELVQVMGQSL